MSTREDAQVERRLTVAPSDLNRLTLNDVGRSIDGQANDAGNERNDSDTGNEEFHDF